MVATDHIAGAKFREGLAAVAAAKPLILPSLAACHNPRAPVSAPLDAVSHLWLGWGWALLGLLDGLSASAGTGGGKAGGDGPTLLRHALATVLSAAGAQPDSCVFGEEAPPKAAAEDMDSDPFLVPTPQASLHIGQSDALSEDAVADAMDAIAPLSASASDSPAVANLEAVHRRLDALRPGRILPCFGSAEDPAARLAAASVSLVAGDDDERLADEDEEDVFDDEAPVACAVGAVQLAEAMSAGLADLEPLSAGGGKEHLMDPRMLNMRKFAEVDSAAAAAAPSAGLQATADGLARLVLSLASDARRDADREQSLQAPGAAAEPTPADVACHLSHFTGLRTFHAASAPLALASAAAVTTAGGDSTPLSPSVAARAAAVAFGSAALGGSLAVCFPEARLRSDACRRNGLDGDTVHDVAIAVTVNRLSGDRSVPLLLLRLVCEELGLPLPADA
jgi:hypothetical protein